MTREGPSGCEPTAVFTIGLLDNVEDADEAACALLGYPRAQLVTMHGTELVPESEHPTTAVSLDRMRRGEIDSAEGQLRRRDGTIVHVDVRAVPRPEGGLFLYVRRRPAS